MSGTHDFIPGQALIGGLVIGVSSGMLMLTTGKIAGNSGALHACVLPDSATNKPNTPKLLFVGGLLTMGAFSGWLMPWAYEPYPRVLNGTGAVEYIVGGLLMGAGTYLANGCTSGHGLSGLSRFSLRSLAAVPTFMGCGFLTAMTKYNWTTGPIVPYAPMTNDHTIPAVSFIAVCAALLAPLFMLTGEKKTMYASLWSGLTFGAGLAIGGMVRPSCVINALSTAKFDFTLWVLFSTALATTFLHYRVAEKRGVSTARANNNPHGIDKRLIAGAALFGVSWGLTGMCPGPLLVGVTAALTMGQGVDPQGVNFGPVLMLFCGLVGTKFTHWAWHRFCQAQPAQEGKAVDPVSTK